MMTSSIDGWSDADKREALESVEPARERTVTDAEHLAGRLKYLEGLHRLRQESGITAAMLRDGRAKGFIDAFKTILRWCDRGGEEPEGLCLHEIEQICRKQLGLELLRPATREQQIRDEVRRIMAEIEAIPDPPRAELIRDIRREVSNARSMSDLAASGGIVDAP